MPDKIIVKGAREHNLKNIDVEIPRDQLVVITGLSGSGKSSLAFDTIFAEGQRRYVESLSAYARQFLGLMEKPDVDQIEGLSPAVSIDQKSVSSNPRSTVGTVTEVYDYLRLLYARIGVPHCPVCGIELEAQSAQQIVDDVLGMEDGKRVQILAPVIQNKKGNHTKVLDELQKSGFVRARIDGEVRELEEPIELDRYVIHNIEAIVDRLVIRRYEENDDEAQAFETRLTDSIETALELGDGRITINDITDRDNPVDILYSEHLACPNGHGSFPELEPRLFSFNTPRGACETCQGLGFSLQVDADMLVPNSNLSIQDGAIDANGWNIDDHNSWTWNVFKGLSEAYHIPLDVPWKDLTQKQRDIFMHGLGSKKIDVRYINKRGQVRVYQTRFEGVIKNLERRYNQTDSEAMRERIESYMTKVPCSACQGQRLRPEALAVTIADENIYNISEMPVAELVIWISGLRGDDGLEARLNSRDQQISFQILNELQSRIGFLNDVGLNYLTLSRSAGSLSGGEAQRIRLASQVGSRLTGVLYVLDEPSIGLHQRDNERLINTLTGLRDLGNTVLVVEHDEDTMRSADWLIDLGPGAGEHGGRVVAEGTPEEVMEVVGSATGDYLSGRFKIETPTARRPGTGEWLTVKGAEENNLRNVDVGFPIGTFTCVTGVSGSGKSSLVVDVLYNKMAQIINGSRERPGKHESIEGVEKIDKVINIDQSPIGRTPRSNPGTYTKMFDDIRSLFAQLPESKIRGYNAGRFSFNVKGGRCEHCGGQGLIRIEMQFLPDVYVECEVCHGTRYNRETLQVHYHGKDIAEILNMTVDEALTFFENQPKIMRKLETLAAVGLGYIRLGQPATTLSGGEAQRIKLSRELSKRATGQTLYVLDEPSTGLHAVDVKRLIDVLQQLVDNGNTIVVIEHNLDIIKVSDYIIDMGPEGGSGGGEVLAAGTPEEIAMVPESHTGRFLKHYVKLAEPVGD
ncbi:excinuclease ABC subunit UvrA [Phototrophicus methaneseepsis]|uniref:UvrABC system protein A n=1 Tax=Phototrophicus methaneseepsis TaxID=2710758 RepID=A0A7S8E7I0_9CHLR|nr:excinuclease ABC subunit UvrA [Phototrophicus methaneseepsis]QPC81805.1 excinuclease ABC subunit UvrA [Phototrophicus methaneseepsis]